MLQLLESSGMDEESAKYVSIALQSSRNLLSIINDILDFSRIEAGKLTIKETPFELDALFKSVIDTFPLQHFKKDVNVSYRFAPDVPGNVVGDMARLRQVLFNLIGNAVKYTAQGSICAEVYVVERTAPDRLRLGINVSDTGIGIAPEQLDFLFEPFTRVDGKDMVKFRGTGLGLSIVKRLVQLMDGTVHLESTPGEGTTVYVEISVGVADETAAPAEPARNAAGPQTGTESLRILVVEDESTNAILMKALLKRMGYDMKLSHNGCEALDYLADNNVDLIFMDVKMPVMGGIEATQRIRAGEAYADKAAVPIIALTAHAMVGDKERFLEAGMNGYIAKPLEKENLQEVLSNLQRNT